jgi:hypothetical protein
LEVLSKVQMCKVDGSILVCRGVWSSRHSSTASRVCGHGYRGMRYLLLSLHHYGELTATHEAILKPPYGSPYYYLLRRRPLGAAQKCKSGASSLEAHCANVPEGMCTFCLMVLAGRMSLPATSGWSSASEWSSASGWSLLVA